MRGFVFLAALNEEAQGEETLSLNSIRPAAPAELPGKHIAIGKLIMTVARTKVGKGSGPDGISEEMHQRSVWRPWTLHL